MKKKKVKVFNAYGDKDKYYEEQGIVGFDKFEYHNQPIKPDGTVDPNSTWRDSLKPIKPLEEDVVEKIKYEFNKDELDEYKRLKKMTLRMQRVYEKCREKENDYYRKLINKIAKEFPDKHLCGGDKWECWLSPIGHCVYENDGDECICIFCGEPEERK